MTVEHKLWALLLALGAALVTATRTAPAQTPPASQPVLTAPAKPASATPAPAKPSVARPTTATPPGSCVTAECHVQVKDFKVLHGPVNVNACEACHTPVDEKAHTFQLTTKKNELCLGCHQIEQPAGHKVHQPVKDGDCLSCHDPHGGTTARFIRAGGMREACAQCHKDPGSNKKNVHGPVAAGACESCHAPHSSKFDHLLVSAGGRDLCFSCHAEMGQQMKKVQFVHKAVEKDCGDCHDPHASDHTMQIRKPPVELCTSCHADVKSAAVDAPHKHGVVVTGEACLNCHTAHGSDLAALMKREPVKVCMSCHNKPQEQDGRKVASVKEVLEPSMVKHGPIRDGNCSGCHNTHGSNVSRLLKQNYPAAFYQDFSIDKYELCFSCHERQLVLTETTDKLTGFRNGQSNLHFVHVNKSQRGRNCRACHETHASGNELHVRDKVPYGNWQMPIAFRKTETGGSCSPGCHKPYEYDRVKPVSYEQASPAAPTPPATAPAPAPGGTAGVNR